MSKTVEEIIQALAAPFPANAIQWKPEAISRDKTKALAVPYIDARALYERLDQVVGVFNWQLKHESIGNNDAAGIGIRHPETGEWIWKFDVGHVSGTDAKSIKGTASDASKRSGYLWNIGRYLYRLPDYWVPYDADKKQLLQVPQLPAWALPEGEKQNGAAQKNTAQAATKTVESPVASNAERMTTVQRANLIALYEKLYLVKGAEAVKGLGEMFAKEFKHSGKEATFEEAKRLEAKLTAEKAKLESWNRSALQKG